MQQFSGNSSYLFMKQSTTPFPLFIFSRTVADNKIVSIAREDLVVIRNVKIL